MQTSDRWSDFDLHVITSDKDRLQQTDWAGQFSQQSYCFHALKAATGGVEKLTVVFETGQMDLILVPAGQMRLASIGLACGFERWHRRLNLGLNEIKTCMQGGYRFIKGESVWGSFYARVVARMPGVRLSDAEVITAANTAVVDALWVWQKIARGEYSAAQHVLHLSLADTNFRLQRELRLRRGESLPSFGLGRRVEAMLLPEELGRVRVDARCDADSLKQATVQTCHGLIALMGELAPSWRYPVMPDETLNAAITSKQTAPQ